MTPLADTTPAAQPSPYIKEITAQNFMHEVVQGSLEVPVLVYFTAAWCGPCKQYGPTLEKVVDEAKGRVKLARVDVDKNPEIAQQFRIQSVPMLYIFLQGQPLDGFAGAMQESQLKQLLEQFIQPGPEAEAAKATLEMAAGLFAQGQVQEAAHAYQAVLTEDGQNVEAMAGVIQCFIALGHLEDAEQFLTQVPQEKQNHEAIVSAKAALDLAKSLPKAADEAKLRKAIAADPKNFQARYDLASALFASQKQEEAIGELLAIIAKNKDWNEGAARAQLLKFFEALGHTHPLTMQGRRKLSSILF
jgi:putative thioredoxin